MPTNPKLVPLEQEDIKVLRESIWHSVQRGDVPDEDRTCLHRLSDSLREHLDEE